MTRKFSIYKETSAEMSDKTFTLTPLTNVPVTLKRSSSSKSLSCETPMKVMRRMENLHSEQPFVLNEGVANPAQSLVRVPATSDNFLENENRRLEWLLKKRTEQLGRARAIIWLHKKKTNVNPIHFPNKQDKVISALGIQNELLRNDRKRLKHILQNTTTKYEISEKALNNAEKMIKRLETELQNSLRKSKTLYDLLQSEPRQQRQTSYFENSLSYLSMQQKIDSLEKKLQVSQKRCTDFSQQLVDQSQTWKEKITQEKAKSSQKTYEFRKRISCLLMENGKLSRKISGSWANRKYLVDAELTVEVLAMSGMEDNKFYRMLSYINKKCGRTIFQRMKTLRILKEEMIQDGRMGHTADFQDNESVVDEEKMLEQDDSQDSVV